MPTKNKKKSALPMEALPDDTRTHLHCLNMITVEEYLDWCRAHGRSVSLHKSTIQRENELSHAERLRSDSCVSKARRARRPNQMLLRLLADAGTSGMPGELHSLRSRLYGEEYSAPQREFTRRILSHLARRCPDLMWDRLTSGAAAHVYLATVIRMTDFHDHTVRAVESWRPRTKNSARRIASLARHLFANWDVPRFLDTAWSDDGPNGDLYRNWFLHLGAGNNIRTGDLPLLYTKKMAHAFTLAPDDYSVIEALRWGQVHGLGGDARIVEGLRGTLICQTFDDDEFWVSVVRFFLRHPMLDTVHFGPIVDYLRNQRFVSDEVVDADGRVHVIPPPQPNLTMNGRTPDSLLAQVEAWHHRLGLGGEGTSRVTWDGSGFRGFQSVEGSAGNRRTWLIRELCSKGQLIAEGSRMNHCVASYVSSCRAGRASIWAMEIEDKSELQKVLTIEVLNTPSRIVQAKGRSNRSPSAQERTVMRRWATAAGLTVAAWV